MIPKIDNNCNYKCKHLEYLMEFTLENHHLVIGPELVEKLLLSFAPPFYESVDSDEPKPVKNQTSEQKLCDSEISQKSVAKKTKVESHQVAQAVELPCSWPECKKKFIYLKKLEIHLKNHAQGKLFDCSYCGRQFQKLSLLKVHTRIHTGEKPYKCTLCPKSFSQRITLTNHLRIHSGEKPYNCNLCSKSFALRVYLRSHIMTHTQEKKYNCQICKRSFAQSRTLQVHKKFHADQLEIPPRIPEKEVGMREAPKLLANKPSDKHSSTCQECQLVCPSLKDLCRHNSHVHNLPKIILFRL